MNYWPLIGVAVVVAGFLARLNPMLVVVTAGFASGIAAGLSIPDLLALVGESFVSNRMPMLVILTLPVIGLLERAGLREHAHHWILGLRGMNVFRLLTTYLGLRQLLAMFGLTTVCGHAQTVRPLIAPMAEAAAEKTQSPLDETTRERTRGMAAATDNVGLFFGEDVLLAFGAVLLIQGFLAKSGIELEALHIALWALPTAIAAFVIHAVRLARFQARLAAAREANDA